MSKEEVDRALAALSATHDRIGVALYAVDTHPGLAVLREPGLTGRTLAVSGEVVPWVGALWGRYVGLGDRLGKVRSARARRSRPGDAELAELTRMIGDPVVEVDTDGVPLDGGGPPAGTVRLTDLAAETERNCAEVAETLAEVDAAATAVIARFRPLDEALAAVRSLAGDLRASWPLEKADGLAVDLQALRVTATADPLDTGGELVAERLGPLDAEITALADRLRVLVRLRAEHPERLARLDGMLDDVAAAETDAARAFVAAVEKVSEPELPAAPSAVGGLREQVSVARSLADGGRWSELDRLLTDLEQSCVRAGTRARSLADAARGLLERRTELRGRLTAYRAKAARLGFAEHPELTACHRQVRDLLYVRPCDLTAAARAMFHYQQMLAELSGHPDAERR